MAKISPKVESRIKEALKRFKPVVEQAKARDIPAKLHVQPTGHYARK